MPQLGPKHAPIQAALAQGNFEQARVAAVRAMARGSDPGLDLLASVAFGRLGLRDQSLFYAKRAADAAPNDVDCIGNLGIALGLSGDSAAAIGPLTRAVELAPTQVQWRASLSAQQFIIGDYAAGVATCRAGLEVLPGSPELTFNLAAALSDLGHHDESAALLRDACLAHPDDTNLRTAACLASHYAESMPASHVRGVHDAYNAALERQLPPDRHIFRNSRDPERKLRIGLVSGDLRRHSVAFFVEPLLEYADAARVEYIAFSTALREDDFSQRLKARCAAWHAVQPLTFEQLTAKIRQQQIDVLIDLSGHTANHSLVTFHQRGAPVQVTMIGYPGTTGVTQMDARIVDRHTDPPEADALHCERLVRVDGCFLCYRPPEDAPEPVSRSADDPNAPVVFGSFNVLRKLGDRTLAAWAQILNGVPRARLMLKAQGLSQPFARDAMMERLKSHGIAPDRVDLLASTATIHDHLELYSRMDIALDPLVYNGTTTTCEAIWMGVPVITARGPVHASRVGTSLLTAIGATELIADGEDAYVARAIALAADRTQRAAYRAGLREQVRRSSLCDGPAYARRIEAALRSLWGEWCERQACERPTRS
ncbi:MAG: hypothetical protein SFY96_06945 [Planctomycetota bacterium]|nr:hypothetical protein [Planctomycetota bacterium]